MRLSRTSSLPPPHPGENPDRPPAPYPFRLAPPPTIASLTPAGSRGLNSSSNRKQWLELPLPNGKGYFSRVVSQCPKNRGTRPTATRTPPPSSSSPSFPDQGAHLDFVLNLHLVVHRVDASDLARIERLHHLLAPSIARQPSQVNVIPCPPLLIVSHESSSCSLIVFVPLIASATTVDPDALTQRSSSRDPPEERSERLELSAPTPMRQPEGATCAALVICV